MRVLVVGAGATGGYFGGRLAEAGADVTFLVRPARRERLAAAGLRIASPFGDAAIPVKTVLADAIEAPYDLVLLSSKAYDLENAIASSAAAVGPDTAVLPVLNGMRHLDVLDGQFGPRRVLGGLCAIASTLDDEGGIVHMNKIHLLVFGERDGADSARCRDIEALMRPANFQSRRSDTILQEMWEKWAFLAALAGITCLMRGSVGDIVSGGGEAYTRAILDETSAVAAAAGYALRPAVVEQYRGLLFDAKSAFTASMLRDVEKGNRVEADHVLGDLIGRGRMAGIETPMLSLAHAHLRTYEARRRREG